MVLAIKPSHTALYNKASSLVLLNKTEECLEALKAAINMDQSYKQKAMHDADFEGIKTLNEFKKLVL